jgi:O-antigen ligase
MKARFLRILSRSWQVAWVLILITLPVTSFPLLSRAAGGTRVAPLAVVPLAWLCLSFLPVHFFSRKPIPAISKPVMFFLAAALVSSAAAFFLDIPPYKDFTLLGNSLESLVTLGIGLAFFTVTMLFIRSSQEMDSALRLIHLGGAVLLVWSLLQVLVRWLVPGGIPAWMNTIQSFISITGVESSALRYRVSGTTLEPSWLAHCLNILYLPLWLASTARRTSAFRFRVLGLSIENILLVCGIGVLVFTYSRIGLLAFGLVLIWFLLLGSGPVSKKLAARFFPARPGLRKILHILIASLLVLGAVGVLGGLAYRLSFLDSRFAALFELDTSDLTTTGNLMVLANRLDIAERVVYWDLGWKVFESHPVLGVGLGNTGMFTLRDMSFYAWKLPELQQVLFYSSTLPNAKNLWVRLLAETGLVGFALFLAWLVVLWFSARRLQGSGRSNAAMLGVAGQFTLVALILEGFSIDTFALPYLWVAFGLLAAAASFGEAAPATTAPGSPPFP